MSAADSVTDAMSSLVLEYNGGWFFILILTSSSSQNVSISLDTDEDETGQIYNGLTNDSNTCV